MTSPEIVETSAREVSAELARRGIAPDQRVVITIAHESGAAGQSEPRVQVLAAGDRHDNSDRLSIAELRRLAEEGRLSGLSDEDGDAFLNRLEAKYRTRGDRR